MLVVPSTPVAPEAPAQQMPAPQYVLMAAAMMHNEGGLFEKQTSEAATNVVKSADPVVSSPGQQKSIGYDVEEQKYGKELREELEAADWLKERFPAKSVDIDERVKAQRQQFEYNRDHPQREPVVGAII